MSWNNSSGQTISNQEVSYKKTDDIKSFQQQPSQTPTFFTPSNPNDNRNSNFYTPNFNTSGNNNQQPDNKSNFYNIGKGIANCINNFNNSNQYQEQNQSTDSEDRFGLESQELESVEMACRDRTTEFAGIIRSQQQGHLSNGAAGMGGRGASTAVSSGIKDLSQYSNFMRKSR